MLEEVEVQTISEARESVLCRDGRHLRRLMWLRLAPPMDAGRSLDKEFWLLTVHSQRPLLGLPRISHPS